MHELVTITAKYLILASILLALYVWLRLDTKGKQRFILLALVGAAITLLLAKLGSAFFYNPRPFVVGHFTPYFTHANDNGFPSDHTLLGALLAFVVYVFRRRWGVIILGLTVLIGVARMAAGVHHAVDIIGAICFALVGVALANLVLHPWAKRQRSHEPR